METQSLLITIVVGIVAGWLAGQIVRGYGFGLLGNLVVGVLGALLVNWLLPQVFHVVVPPIGSGMLNTIVWATIGAVVLLLLVGLVRRAR